MLVHQPHLHSTCTQRQWSCQENWTLVNSITWAVPTAATIADNCAATILDASHLTPSAEKNASAIDWFGFVRKRDSTNYVHDLGGLQKTTSLRCPLGLFAEWAAGGQ